MLPVDRRTMASSLLFPLPRGWRGWVRQALVHAVALGRVALAEVRAGFERRSDPLARLAAEFDRERERGELLLEENRILRARLACISLGERPRYPPAERLAILMLRARAGWNAAETARRFLLAPATIAAWTQARRAGGGGPGADIRARESVQ
jgi:hypothetical protein